jgi:hypothetical protein
MPDLNAFVEHNIEGYLFNDLRHMQQIPVGYPLLMATFAGIELLGALTSPATFNPYRGSSYFQSYWTAHLYPRLKDTNRIGKVLYKLVRHGIAHGFVLKGPIGVTRDATHLHLTRNADGIIRVDAVRLADDFMTSFETSVRPLLTSSSSMVNASTMSARLHEIDAAYQEEYQKEAAKFPVTTADAVAETAAVSHSTLPPPTSPPSGRPSGSAGI